HRAIVIEYEQANRRRQVGVEASGIDQGDQFGHGDLAIRRDLLQSVPERLFQSDAGLVTIDCDRTFDDERFHDPLHESTPDKDFPNVPPVFDAEIARVSGKPLPGAPVMIPAPTHTVESSRSGWWYSFEFKYARKVASGASCTTSLRRRPALDVRG